MSECWDVAVVGGGAAGTMAALRAVLFGLKTLWYLGDVDARRRSRAPWVSDVHDLPGWPGQSHPLPAQQVAVQDWIAQQPGLAEKLTVLKVSVQQLAHTPEGFTLTHQEVRRRQPVGAPQQRLAKTVVLTTGLLDLQPVVQGSIEPIFPYANANQALYCLRSDGHRVLGHETAVIGHTPLALETLQRLQRRHAPSRLSLLTHGEPLEVSRAQQQWLDAHGVPVYTSPLVGFEGVARKEGLQAVRLADETRVACTRLVVALGVRYHHGLALQVGAQLDEAGAVLTDAHGESSVPRLFVAGDLRSGTRKQIYSAWESAVAAVERIEESLHGL